MINAFRKSQTVCWAVRAAVVFIIALVWINDLKRGYELYIPIVATALLIAIGYFLSRLLGNLVASSQNTRLLGYLHMELDPDKFIEAYQDIPGRLKHGSRDRAVASAYLADGYAARGDAKKALATLEDGFEGLVLNEQYSLQGLYHGNRLAYLLDDGNVAEAKTEAEALSRTISACRSRNKALADNLSGLLDLRSARIGIAEGKKAEGSRLEAMLASAGYKLLRLEIWRTLAENAVLRGARTEAGKYFTRIGKEAGKTFYRDLSGKPESI